MEVREIISYLKNNSSEKYKQNIIKLGIPEERCIGVPTGEIRKLAKQAGKSQKLAVELWNTGYHEAKLLAVLIMDKKTVTLTEIEVLMNDVASWDLCDHLCKNLIIRIGGFEQLIDQWCDDDRVYYKRAAYTLIASAVIHKKDLSKPEIDSYLNMIKLYSKDDRLHVKKAVSWALREIGKKNYEYQEQALIVAHELSESGNKSMAWIGKDAIKELESLTDVIGRTRLISTKSEMAKTNTVP